MPERGSYIVLEGGEYVGKSTQAQLLAQKIGGIIVREPGSTPIGENIRTLILDPNTTTAPKTEALLFAAQRAELVQSVIHPAITAGRNVISDRSWISSAAYQHAQGLALSDIRTINRFALGRYTRPDILLLLDANPSALLDRAPNTKDYYEQRELSFHEQIRSNYLSLCRSMGAVVIDASQSVDAVAEEINCAVQNTLNL